MIIFIYVVFLTAQLGNVDRHFTRIIEFWSVWISCRLNVDVRVKLADNSV